MIGRPTCTGFVYSLEKAPVFFVDPTLQQSLQFKQEFLSIKRSYYRAVRNYPTMSDEAIFSESSALSCGECAILTLRSVKKTSDILEDPLQGEIPLQKKQ
jgi:hypothetical protein